MKGGSMFTAYKGFIKTIVVIVTVIAALAFAIGYFFYPVIRGIC